MINILERDTEEVDTLIPIYYLQKVVEKMAGGNWLHKSNLKDHSNLNRLFYAICIRYQNYLLLL